MIVTGTDDIHDPDDPVKVASWDSSTNQVTLSKNITVSGNTNVTFHVKPENNTTYHNMLRNKGDLEDTYIKPTSDMSEIFNAHEGNDAHQIQRMLFSGHMMNVTTPTAMPASTTTTPPEETMGQRPILSGLS